MMARSWQIGRWLAPVLSGLWVACAPGRSTHERPVISKGMEDTLKVVHEACLKATAVYSRKPCGVRPESECRVLPFYYLGDNLLPGERKAMLETDTANKVQYISVQGSDNATDWVVDFDIGMVQAKELGMDVHRGFWQAAVKMDSLLQKHLIPGYTLKVTGHSLGGAIAVLVAEKLTLQKRKVESCITFGQPKVTNKAGAAAAADSMRDVLYIRVVNQNDIVPNVPPVDNPLFYRNLLDAPVAFGLESWNGSSKSMYYHFGRELPLGESVFGKLTLKPPSRNQWVTLPKLAISLGVDHFMCNYVAHMEDLLGQADVDFKSMAKLAMECPSCHIAECAKLCRPVDFQIQRGRRDTYYVATKTPGKSRLDLSVRSLAENGDSGMLLARDTVKTGPKPKEQAMALRPTNSILGGGGWVRLDYKSADTVCYDTTVSRQYRRAFPQHTLEFRLGWQGGREDWWPPSVEWLLRANSAWFDWLRGGVEFGLTSIQPWDVPEWHDLVEEGVDQFDPFKGGGQFFLARFILQYYPVPASYYPSFQAGVELLSQPGGDSLGVGLFPAVFLKTQVDIPGWHGQTLGLVRGGVARSSLLASESPAGKGDYIADVLLEAEIGSPLIGGPALYPLVRLASDTPLWREDFGPSLFTAGLLLNVNLGAMGRIFGLSN